MKYIITINGATGVGKSIATEYFSKHLNVRFIHPIHNIKCFFENLVGLENGALETAKGKSFIPEGSTHDMHTILKEMYHTFKVYWPNYSIFDMKANIDNNGEQNLIFASLRNFTELEFIKELQKEGYKHFHVSVYRDVKTLSSDENVSVINNELEQVADHAFVINNNSGLDEYYVQLRKIIYKIFSIVG